MRDGPDGRSASPCEAVIPPPGRTPLVYVVDDDTDVLGSLRFLLETDGFCVRTFRSAEALLNSITMAGADCFVIDYKMPGMNGIDLAGVLRQRDVDTPIILITGDPDASIPAKAAAAGIRHVLVKPHVKDSLSSHIWDAINGDSRAPARKSPHLRDST
jgi:two-component system, LuxR family, response regulator FixJ